MITIAQSSHRAEKNLGYKKSKKATAPGRGRTAVEYRDTERKLVIRDPLGGTTEFLYDRAGRQIAETRPDGFTERYAYNQLGRVEWYAGARDNALRLNYSSGAGHSPDLHTAPETVTDYQVSL